MGKVDSRPTSEAFSIPDASGNAHTMLVHCSESDDSANEELFVKDSLPLNTSSPNVFAPLVELV